VTEYGLNKWGTGPDFLRKLLREFPDATIFPAEYFHSGRSGYTINHHAHSWKDTEDWYAAFVKAQRKLDEARGRIEELERWSRRAQKLRSPFHALRRSGQDVQPGRPR
jgi:hypothetical protein